MSEKNEIRLPEIIVLAPVYDLVATRVYKTTSEMSFFIGGDLDIEKINRKNFSKAADEIDRLVLVVWTQEGD